MGSTDHWMTRSGSSYLPQKPTPKIAMRWNGSGSGDEGCRGLGCEATGEALSYGTAEAVGQQQRFHSRIGSDRSLGGGWAMRGRGKVRDSGEEKLVRFQGGRGAPLRSEVASERLAVAVRRLRPQSRAVREGRYLRLRVWDAWRRERRRGGRKAATWSGGGGAEVACHFALCPVRAWLQNRLWILVVFIWKFCSFPPFFNEKCLAFNKKKTDLLLSKPLVQKTPRRGNSLKSMDLSSSFSWTGKPVYVISPKVKLTSLHCSRMGNQQMSWSSQAK